tara:strand:+ start:2404 stop:3672 length:1269 start_codon:yes stop_codon:yes gene_type:complete
MMEGKYIRSVQGKKRLRYAVDLVLWSCLAALTVVLPNAFKQVAVSVLIATAAYYLVLRGTRLSVRLSLIWAASAFVTIFYSLIGLLNGAPDEAIRQVIVVYILSPLLWLFALKGALEKFGLAVVVNFLVTLTVLAIFSQAFYFWAISSHRFSDILFLMAGEPNLDYSNNRVAAVMFVFGSMTFLYAGLFASPETVRWKPLRLLLLFGSFVSVLTSGRGALVLSIFFGVSIYLVTSVRRTGAVRKALILNALVLLVSSLVGSYVLLAFYDINVFGPVQDVWGKISSGGGEGRKSYLPLLIEGSADHFFLGAGHGIGVDFSVSEDFPWRYEVVGAADLFRVGILGLLVYASPFLISLRSAFVLNSRRRLDRYEKYLLGALVAEIFIANTNPYIEAVVFQWMFVLPCVYFIDQVNLRSFRRSVNG